MLVLLFLSLETAVILSISPWSWSSFSVPRAEIPLPWRRLLPRAAPRAFASCAMLSGWLRFFDPLTLFSRICLQVLWRCLISSTCLRHPGAEWGGCRARVSEGLQRVCWGVPLSSLTQGMGSFIPLCVITCGPLVGSVAFLNCRDMWQREDGGDEECLHEDCQPLLQKTKGPLG